MLTLSVALAAPPVRAQVPTQSPASVARKLVSDGIKEFNSGKYAAALQLFEDADEMLGRKVPSAGVWLAKAQERRGFLIEARDTALRVTRLPVGASEPNERAFRDEAEALARSVTPRIPKVRINVSGVVGGVPIRVTLNSDPPLDGSSPFEHEVNPARYQIAVKVNGYRPAQREVQVEEAKVEEVSFDLTPDPPPSPPPGSPPPASAPIEGSAPLRSSMAPPRIEPPPGSPDIRRTLGFVGLGVGALGIGVGAVTGSMVLARHADLARVCPGDRCPEEQHGAVAGYNALGATSTVGFLVGGAAAAAGTLLLVTAPARAPRSALVTAYLGPGQMVVHGRF